MFGTKCAKPIILISTTISVVLLRRLAVHKVMVLSLVILLNFFLNSQHIVSLLIRVCLLKVLLTLALSLLIPSKLEKS